MYYKILKTRLTTNIRPRTYINDLRIGDCETGQNSVGLAVSTEATTTGAITIELTVQLVYGSIGWKRKFTSLSYQTLYERVYCLLD